MNASDPTRDIMQALSRMPLLPFQLGWGPALEWLPLLALTTRDHETGEARHTVLEFRRHGSKLYIVSGLGEEADWVRDIAADPRVTAQHGAQVYAAKAARVDDSAEAMRALYAFSRNSPLYETLFARMSSANAADLNTLADVAAEFTVLRIEPADDEVELPPVPQFSPQTQQMATIVAALLALRIALVALRAIVGGRRD